MPVPHKLLRLGVAIASGLILVLAFPSKHFPIGPWFCLAMLMGAVAGVRPRFAALCGYLQGVAFFTPTLTWLYTTFRIHGDVSVVMSAVALGALVAAASFFPAAFAWAFAWIWKRGPGRACAAAPFLWVALEFGRDKLPSIGFPWNLIGYAAAHSLALAQMTTLGGIWMLSFFVAGFNALLVWAWIQFWRGHRAPVYATACIAVLIGAIVAFGDAWVPMDQPDHEARLIQPNFPEDENMPRNWMDLHAGELAELERMSTAPEADGRAPGLVVWPEVPTPFSMQDPRFAALTVRIAKQTRDGFLSGEIEERVKPGEGWQYFNSAVLHDPEGRETFLYDKIHLVPFSEYVPWASWFKVVQSITLEVGNFQQGTEFRVGTFPDGRRFCVYICYEAVFPGEVRKFAANGAELFVNISNDGWFGRTAGPEQHLEMARVRAIENRRWLLRCTNNGFTVTVDPYGHETARLPADTRAALDARYGYRSDKTLYTRWGDWFPFLCAIAAILIVALSISRKMESLST
ncbi:MAG TPA: apolipoprotein N-acyltransferase [Candidatus Acidoferrales bacterium]|nr:apolipoprotein N-acyltransferase [Candidatus Acidoferrales bacterium]